MPMNVNKADTVMFVSSRTPTSEVVIGKASQSHAEVYSPRGVNDDGRSCGDIIIYFIRQPQSPITKLGYETGNLSVRSFKRVLPSLHQTFTDTLLGSNRILGSS